MQLLLENSRDLTSEPNPSERLWNQIPGEVHSCPVENEQHIHTYTGCLLQKSRVSLPHRFLQIRDKCRGTGCVYSAPASRPKTRRGIYAVPA